MMKKINATFISVFGIFIIGVAPAFAHVVVSPSQVKTAAYQDFTVNVPNEKDNPITGIQLLIPSGLTSVVPNATPGWTISTKSTENGNNAAITEIDWTNGNIPVGQRAELVFQAQVPVRPTTLDWKAYQIYSDGTTMSWDINPETMKNMSDAQQDQLADQENKGVFSTTQVVNDVANSSMQSSRTTNSTDLTNTVYTADVLAAGAFILSVVGIVLALRRK